MGIDFFFNRTLCVCASLFSSSSRAGSSFSVCKIRMSSSFKSEIVTLQFGEYANHVGAHFWNFQDELIGLSTAAGFTPSSSSSLFSTKESFRDEEQEKKENLANANRFNAIDHGCLYRQGETRGGEITQTPRCVAYDLRSSLGGVKQLGYLCDEGDDFFSSPLTVSSASQQQKVVLKTWTGEVRVHEQPRAKKSEYLRRLEEEEGEGVEVGEKIAAEEEIEEEEEEDDDELEKKKEKNGRVAVVASDDVVENNEADIDRLVEAAKKLKHDAMHWTDFSKALFHPRTVQVVDGIFETSSEGVKSFAGFGEGASWAMELDRRENLREDIRKWVEECDYLRGFHVFVEDHSGFGGLCEKVLEEVRDAHGQGVSILTFCCRKPRDEEVKINNNRNDDDDNEFLEITQKRNNERRFMLNDGLSLARISPLTDAYIPLYGSQTNGQQRSAYQTSARIATAIDTITTPWRLQSTPGFESYVGAETMATFLGRMQSQANAPFLQTSMFTRRGDFTFEEDKISSMEPLFTSSSSPSPKIRRNGSNDNDEEDDDDEDAEEALAESHVIRGAPFCQSRRVCEQLEERLRAGQRVAGIPIGRCVAGASLPLPMTYPTDDDGNTTSKSPLLSVHAMTRQTRTQERMLSERANNFERASRNSGGKAMLTSWGYDVDETCEVVERIRTNAKRYVDDDV